MEAATGLAGGLRQEDSEEEEVDQDRPFYRSPAGMREEPLAAPVTRVETLGIFFAFFIVYALLGFRLIDLHVVNFDALDRLSRAFMVWYNDPPKLASIGFSLPPIGTLVLVPFAAIKGLVTSGWALPLSSALFGAGALVFINRLLAMGDMLRTPRLLLVLLVAVNPMFAYYAMNGSGDVAGLTFVAFGLFCIIGWGRNGSARYLIGAGLAFSLAVLTNYEYIVWAIFVAFVISAALTKDDRDRFEVEGSVIAYLAPIMYMLGVWIFLNAVVLGDPFAWVTPSTELAPVNAVSSGSPEFSLLEALGNALRIQLIFPVALLAIPLLLVADARRGIGGGLALLLVINILYSVVMAAIAGSVDVIELRDALPAIVAGCAGIAWAYLRAEQMRNLTMGLTILFAVLALPLAWWQMQTYPHQNLEQAFTRAVATGEDQEGSASRGGFQVGVAPEREMAAYIEDLGVDGNAILTDNARTYGVINLTGDPGLFFDRVDKGDTVWNSILDNPQGKVDYFLVEKTDADLILQEYPGADNGDVGGLEPVVSNQRYVLLQVDPARAPGEESSDSSTSSTGTTDAPPANSTSAPPPSGTIAPPTNSTSAPPAPATTTTQTTP